MGIYKASSQDEGIRKNCIGMLVCPHCGDAVICENISPNHVINSEEIQETENNNMIPRGNISSQPSGNGKGRRKGSGLKYLSAEMLSSAHQLATIADARIQPDNFKPEQTVVVVKLKFKGEYILWTLRANNPNLEALGDAFGDDETTWGSKEIELFVEEDEFDGKKWIRVDPITATGATKATTKARK